jgi:pilus assembly protein CpaB
VRASTIVMIGFAVLFGLLAVFIANVWLKNQANHRAQVAAPAQAVPTQTIVVANQPLRFGTEITEAMLKEVPWPSKDIPAGAFSKISELMTDGHRTVLSAIEPNEPVLAVKVTGAGQRATLSALVRPGMKAVTIRVNDVEGVGGFVLPGDHVDVVLTRQLEKGQATTEVVLQNARVLATDQSADERTSKPNVAKSVTLEVTMLEAQKVWLASSVGSLSLLLRKAGEANAGKTRKITLKDLFSGDLGDKGETTTIVVTRATSKQEYTVPVEGKDGTLAGAERRQAAW